MSGGSPTLTLVPVSVSPFKNVRRDSLTRLVMKLDMGRPPFEVLVITYMYDALLARGCGPNSVFVFFITADCAAFVQLSENSLERTSEIISSLKRNCEFLKSSDT